MRRETCAGDGGGPAARARADRAGTLLVEAALALVVLEVLLVTTLGSTVKATRTLAEAGLRHHALREAEALADSLAWMGLRGSGVHTGAWGRLEWAASGSALAVDVFGPGGAATPWTRLQAVLP
ncbi:MAG: hypothetical protein R3E98_05625 [Gemmatimonadota bacterium]|nr:hypothetical protein [Gemmatimonadota bacterium]